MRVPLELSFHNLPEERHDDAREAALREVSRLDRIADFISCRVAIERPQRPHRTGNPLRVRVQVTMPPQKELVAAREAEERTETQALFVAIRRSFRALERQLKATVRRRRGDVKRHHGPEVNFAIVVRIFADGGYAFIKDIRSGEEIYVHEHAVVGGDFHRLEEGTQVRYTASPGDEGPQASSVQIHEKPGAASSRQGEPEVRPPAGWARADER